MIYIYIYILYIGIMLAFIVVPPIAISRCSGDNRRTLVRAVGYLFVNLTCGRGAVDDGSQS